MTKYVVQHGHTYDDLDEALKSASFVAKYYNEDIHVKVLVETDRDAWTYGGPQALEEYHRVAGQAEFVEIDRKVVRKTMRMLD